MNRMKPILRNLIDIGIGYLSLNRGVGTLSGGEIIAEGTPEQIAQSSNSCTVVGRAGLEPATSAS